MRIDRFFLKKASYWIQVNICKQKYAKIQSGPLKGFYWNTSSDYRYVLGTFEDKFVTVLSYLAKGGDNPVFYDLGANYGYLSLVYNKLDSNAQIFSFEPNKTCIDNINVHILINNLAIKNINIIANAVSDCSKIISFSDSNAFASNTSVIESEFYSKTAKVVKVKAINLDQFVYLEGNPCPDILKINIEGDEYNALVGSNKILLQKKPIILLCTHECHNPGVKIQCLDFLSSKGYKYVHVPKRQVAGLDDFICYHESLEDRYKEILNFVK